MVRYYGRARQRTGSVNTNQLGLKMSGCPSKIGKQGALVRYQSRRVQCNQKFIGPVYYQGQMWSFNNTGVERAPRNQSFNSGVGHINAPRFGCALSCSTDLPSVGYGFALLAGSVSSTNQDADGNITENNLVGFLRGGFTGDDGIVLPSVGSLTLEDKSPIKREDIQLLTQNLNCRDLDQQIIDGVNNCYFTTIINITPAIGQWLVKKVTLVGSNVNDTGIPGFNLHINGIQYKNISLAANNDKGFFGATFAPVTDQNIIEMKPGQTYNVSFS